MTVGKMINILAGFMMILGLTLAHINGQVDMLKPSWLWLCAFVGLNLFQSAFTGICPAGTIFRALGAKDDGRSCCASRP